MRFVVLSVLLVAGCASVDDESHPPQRRADYKTCQQEAQTTSPAFAIYAINKCMKAKGW